MDYNPRAKKRAHNPHQILPPPSRPGSAPWQSSYGLFLSGSELIEDVRLLAREMEAKWGAGGLRQKVGAELREKFDRQRYLHNQAIYSGDLEDVRRESSRMIKAYRALDANATATGAAPRPHEQWEAVLDDGTALILVKGNDDARRVERDGRRAVVWTMAEVAWLVDQHTAVQMAKLHFPGAEVIGCEVAAPDPLSRVPTTLASLDDDLSDFAVDDCPF